MFKSSIDLSNNKSSKHNTTTIEDHIDTLKDNDARVKINYWKEPDTRTVNFIRHKHSTGTVDEENATTFTGKTVRHKLGKQDDNAS